MHPSEPPRPAVFLDRDDTLNANAALPDAAFPGTRGDLHLPGWVTLLPGAAAACASLRNAGYALVIVTNQACVARGHARLEDVDATNDQLRSLLAQACGGVDPIEAVYVAPHHPDARVAALRSSHPWRKPAPGMLHAAAADLGLDLDRSWLIGDQARDREAGLNAGLRPDRCLLIGHAGHTEFPDLAAAARRILAGPTTPPPPAPPELVAASTVHLRALAGAPLADPAVRGTVEAVAHAIAERTGVRLLAITCDADAVRVTLATHRLAALGFIAELRRLSNRWHAARHGGALLWPALLTDGPDDAGPDDDILGGDTAP